MFPLSPTVKDEEDLGWSMAGCVGAILVGNLALLVTMSILELKRKLRLKKARKAYQENLLKNGNAVEDSKEESEPPAPIKVEAVMVVSKLDSIVEEPSEAEDDAPKKDNSEQKSD